LHQAKFAIAIQNWITGYSSGLRSQ